MGILSNALFWDIETRLRDSYEERLLVSLWNDISGESVPTARGNLTLRGGLYAVDGDLIL